MRKGSGRETSQRTATLLDSQGKPLIQRGLRQLTSSSSARVDYSERRVTIGSTSTFRRQLLERYTHVREDHLRYMQKWGLIRPEPRATARRYYAFPDLAVIRQADETLAEGASFRAVLRNLLASRSGQLAFDFRIEAQPAKVLQLKRREPPPLARADGSRRRRRRRRRPSSYFLAASMLDDGDPANFDEAAAAYRRALEIDPYLVPALINLANIHYARDEIAEAQALYERAIALEPDVFEAHFNLGNILHDLGRYAEAQALLPRRAAAQPDVRRRALLSGGDAGEERAVAGGAAALAGLPAAGARTGSGWTWRRNFRIDATSKPLDAMPYVAAGATTPTVVSSVVVRAPLLRRAAQLVVLAVRAPGVGVEPGRAGVRLHLAVRAERACCRPRSAAASGTSGSARTPPTAGRPRSPARGGRPPVPRRRRRRRRPRASRSPSRAGGVVIEVGRQRLSPAREARALLRERPASARSPLIRRGRSGRRDARTLRACPAPRS